MKNSISRLILMPVWMITLISTAIVTGSTGSDDSIVLKRAEFASRLDSLEMVEQSLKRQGLSISDVDEQCRLLRDSIDAIKSNISLPESPSTTADVGKPEQKIVTIDLSSIPFLPQSVKEWTLFGVGAMVLLCIILLATGLVRLIFRKKDSKSSLPKTDSFNWGVGPDAGTSKPLPDLTEGLSAKKIDSLRNRVSNDLQKLQQLNHQDSRPASVKSDGEQIGRSAELVKAAESGMDTAEIARQFQMSADQVALMLTIARKKIGS